MASQREYDDVTIYNSIVISNNKKIMKEEILLDVQ